MGLGDMFAPLLGNPFFWVFMGLFILGGLLIGLLLRPWAGNEVIKFVPGSHTFQDYPIDEETSVSVQCKRKKGYPIQRFFKLHPGFTGVVGRILKKPITRYLGIEGTAYTWNIEEGTSKLLGSLDKAVRALWGEEFYSSIPKLQKQKLEESRIQVTVGLDQAPKTPEGMRSISEEDIKEEEDRRAAKVFWEENESKSATQIVTILLALGAGAGIMAVLFLTGIIKTPVQYVPVPTPGGNATATVAKFLLGMI